MEREQRSEQLRSFNELASINLCRSDLQVYGHILPETRQRIMDEELSFLAEGIDRASRTSFVFKRDETGALQYFDNGDWVGHTAMLQTGLEVAKAEAVTDHRRSFLVDWARRDLAIGYKIRGLQPGQTLSWHNGFPHDIAAQYGDDFLEQCGLQVSRQMGFLYQAVCHDNGSVEMISQTVDRSDADAFATVQTTIDHDPQADMDTLTRAYDGALHQKYGGHFYAGSREYEHGENAWHVITQQQDLARYLLDGIEELASGQLDGEALTRQARAHVYGVWATFKRRLDGDIQAPNRYQTEMAYDSRQLQVQVTQSLQLFSQRHVALIGCGGKIEMQSSDVLAMGGDQAMDSIFGAASKAETYSFNKFMYCVVCQAPPEEKASKKLCGPCGICKGCDRAIQAKAAGKGALAA